MDNDIRKMNLVFDSRSRTINTYSKLTSSVEIGATITSSLDCQAHFSNSQKREYLCRSKSFLSLEESSTSLTQAWSRTLLPVLSLIQWWLFPRHCKSRPVILGRPTGLFVRSHHFAFKIKTKTENNAQQFSLRERRSIGISHHQSSPNPNLNIQSEKTKKCRHSCTMIELLLHFRFVLRGSFDENKKVRCS